jgi:hypothetical protein
VEARLESLSNLIYLQQGDLTSNKTKHLFDKFLKRNNIVDHLFVVNKNNIRFLVVFDRNGTMLANGASKTLVGKNFFVDYTQKFHFTPITTQLNLL